MNGFVKYFLKNRAVTWLLLVLVLVGGLFSYVHMGKLEDAPFTIKQALVLTPYPGASPAEVQEQVTDVLEESIQSLGELYYLKTENRAGMSKITVYVKKEIRADQMQQLWDKLRRKVSDVQSKLPAGAGPSVVNDDSGDVLGVFYGITGDGRTYRELEDQAKLLKNELLKVKDVARVEVYGMQTPTIDVTVRPSVLARGGLTTADIARAFAAQNKVVDAGAVETAENRLRIESTGNFYSLDDIRRMTITSQTGEDFRLADIARVEEGYKRPAGNIMRIDGKPALGVAVATVSTGNVVDMARAVAECIDRFERTLPEGFDLHPIYDQGYESEVANRGFVWNLIISVLTVVGILLFFIGFKNGILIGSGLVFSIFATLIVMYVQGIALQRMSLAAIIIAMGMLVDNAIVVSDSALVNMQRGMRKRVAILRACSSTALPLLAATAIAILTFMPIYYSPHITGELLSSLVIVIGISLMFSWVFAMTQTPFFIQQFVRRPRPDELKGVPFSGRGYDRFRSWLRFVIRHKFATLVLLVGLLVLSAWGFRFVPRVFTPSLDKAYFTLDMWLPEGTRIEKTDTVAARMVDYVAAHESVETVSSYVGRTPPRYYLSNISIGPQSNYAQQPEPPRDGEEPEVESREQQPRDDPDQRHRQDAENNHRFAEVPEQGHQNDHQQQERHRKILHQRLHRFALVLELRIPEEGVPFGQFDRLDLVPDFAVHLGHRGFGDNPAHGGHRELTVVGSDLRILPGGLDAAGQLRQRHRTLAVPDRQIAHAGQITLFAAQQYGHLFLAIAIDAHRQAVASGLDRLHHFGLGDPHGAGPHRIVLRPDHHRHIAPLVAGIGHLGVATHDLDGHPDQRIEHRRVGSQETRLDQRLGLGVQLEAVDLDQRLGKAAAGRILQKALQ